MPPLAELSRVTHTFCQRALTSAAQAVMVLAQFLMSQSPTYKSMTADGAIAAFHGSTTMSGDATRACDDQEPVDRHHRHDDEFRRFLQPLPRP